MEKLIQLGLTVFFFLVAFQNPVDASLPLPFNDSIALTNVYLSYAAYCGTLVNPWDCYWCRNVPGFQVVGTFGTTDTAIFGYVGYLAQNIYVVFRGTDNGPGWLSDGQANFTPYYLNSSTYVHSGFQTLILSVRCAIKDLVAEAQLQCGTNCTVYVTGHSLGAAVATLGALDLTISFNYNVILYNFGSPRVGNCAFAEWAQGILYALPWRMTWEQDIFPQLPPKVWGYRHIAREIWWNGTNFKQCSPSNGEDLTGQDSTGGYNPVDHALYMNVFTLSPQALESGCLYTDPGSTIPSSILPLPILLPGPINLTCPSN